MICHKSKYFAIFILLIHLAAFSQTVLTRDQQTFRRTAEAFEQAGQTEHAAEYYSRAVLADPKDIAAYLGARRCYDKLFAYDQLEKLVLELQNTHRDLRYRVDLAWIQYKRGDESGARKAWEQIVEENSTQEQTYSLIGEIYVENQQYDAAVDLYLLGRKNLKNDLAFMYELTNIYQITNEQTKLADEYVAFVKTNPQQLDFLSAELQRFVQAQENINPLLKSLEKSSRSPDSPHWAVHLFLADAYTIKKDYGNAFLHVAELEASLLKVDAKTKIRSYDKGKYLYEFAVNALDNNAIDYAERAFMLLINDYSDSRYVAVAKMGLARVYTNQKQYEKALDALQLFVDQNKRSSDARLALMQMGEIAYQELFDIDRAEKAYARVLKEYPNVTFQIEALFRLADCATAKDDLTLAENYLQRALRMSSAIPTLNGACLMYLAYLEFYRMHPTASLSYLDDFSNIVFPTSQINVFENDALELSMLLQENSYDSTGLAQLGKSALLMKQRNYEQAKNILEKYLQENPNSSLQSELRLRLADVYKELNEFAPAIIMLDSVYADTTSFYRDMALLAAAEIFEKDMVNLEMAQQRYEKILIEFPDSIYLETARERVRELENKK